MTNAATALPERPVDGDRVDRLHQAVDAWSPDELVWASGYLAGLAAAASGRATAPAPAGGPAGDTWHLYFAGETGNSRRVTEALAARARDAGFDVEVNDLRDVKPRTLARIRHALFVVATHGVGEPPDGSEPFFEYWLGASAPRVEQLSYSVLALGDSSYADFCATGIALDERLQALGATKLADRVDCDLDFDTPASAWSERVLEQAAAIAPARRTAPLRAVRTTPAYSRAAPFRAEVLLDQPITASHSSKAVHHIELGIDGSGFDYLPGDSLGVVATNPEVIVDAVLAATGLDGDATVDIGGRPATLGQALKNAKEITALGRPLLDTVAASHAELRAVIDDRDALRQFVRSHQVIDVVSDYPVEWRAQQLTDALRNLTPRLYSIASSPDANPGEVHLAVGEVRYQAFGREHLGSASTFLTGGIERAPVYLERNDHFRLPANGDTPIVMIGAGTGVAPYRAFVEHRAEHGQRGRNWLFFGDRNFSSDFLYQLEWLRYRKSGLLTKLDVAFSRDQRDKVYVQHRLLERAAELGKWIDDGAHIYVCGDADHMAVDVQRALISVLAQHGGLDNDAAAARLKELKAAGRYQRDVY